MAGIGEIVALAKGLGGSGGGSSGGGVLVVNDNGVDPLDKTAGEIMAAGEAGIVIVKYAPDECIIGLNPIIEFAYNPSGYMFNIISNGSTIRYTAATSSDYPSVNNG